MDLLTRFRRWRHRRRLRYWIEGYKGEIARLAAMYQPSTGHCCPACATGGFFDKLCTRLEELEDELAKLEV